MMTPGHSRESGNPVPSQNALYRGPMGFTNNSQIGRKVVQLSLACRSD